MEQVFLIIIITIIIIGLLKTPFAAQRLNCTVVIQNIEKTIKYRFYRKLKFYK